jgi:hypothetical protein
MIARYDYLHRFPSVFQSLTGLTLDEFAQLVPHLLPSYQVQEHQRLSTRPRQRAIGAGRDFALDPRDQLLATLVCLRRYPTHELLGWLFGVSDSTTVRIVQRFVPLRRRLGTTPGAFPIRAGAIAATWTSCWPTCRS